MGRACAIVVCGHENDNIYNTQVLAPANYLNVYWYPDQRNSDSLTSDTFDSIAPGSEEDDVGTGII